jgi:formylglycine-generating enzyme required for sulfatase activity
MVYVPAGEFLMGLTEEEAEAAWKECGEHCEKSMFFNEVPQHKVYLDAYWIYKTEVSNDMFTAFVKETQWKTEAELNGFGWLFINIQEGANWQHPAGENSTIEGKGNHPVVQVSWQDAKAYCEWAGGRLPTEAEWEKAARGTDGRRYPWGNLDPTGGKLNYCDKNCEFSWADKNIDDKNSETAPVGSYPAGASPYGALDMAGNVWEWVQDWYAEDYYANSPKDTRLDPLRRERVLRVRLEDPYL